MKRLFLPAILLLAVVINLSSCRRSSRVASERAKGALATPEQALQVTFPSSWKLRQEDPRRLLLTEPTGCALHIMVAPAGERGLSQQQILELMKEEEQHYFEQQGGRVELLGKQVWMGRHYIWHELLYSVSCDPLLARCTDSVCLAFLAPVDAKEEIRARFICPKVSSLREDVHAQLVQVIDSIFYSP